MPICAKAERVLLLAGLAMLGICAVSYVGGKFEVRRAVNEFKRELPHVDAPALYQGPSKVDKTLWSDRRIRDHEASLAKDFDAPPALLQIPRLRLEVPVLEGTEELVLNRGVGRFIRTARPGEEGNIAIAGHRDGSFHLLNDMAPADTLHSLTRHGVRTYVVDSLQIANPDDVSVFRSSDTPAVTLVTRYPFFFIGSAPKRLIVHASLQPNDLDSARRSVRISSTDTNLNCQENRR